MISAKSGGVKTGLSCYATNFHVIFLTVQSLNSLSEVCGTIQCMNRGVCMLCEIINQLQSLFYLYHACLIHLLTLGERTL